MKEIKQNQNLVRINSLLSELYDILDNQEAKSAVQTAYNTINKPDKVTEKYKEVPDAIDKMKRDFSRISLVRKKHFTREQEEIVSKLTFFTNQCFRKGFEGLVYASLWF
ncbi:hypothetical protein AB9M75_04440 [Lactobacillus sp. AN1001]